MSEATCLKLVFWERIHSFVELLLNAYLWYLVTGAAEDYRCIASHALAWQS